MTTQTIFLKEVLFYLRKVISFRFIRSRNECTHRNCKAEIVQK